MWFIMGITIKMHVCAYKRATSVPICCKALPPAELRKAPWQKCGQSECITLYHFLAKSEKIGTKKLKNAEMECADLYVQYVHKNALR